MAYHTCNEDVMSPNGTHPKAESQTATIRLKCALNVRLAQKPLRLRMSAATTLAHFTFLQPAIRCVAVTYTRSTIEEALRPTPT